MSVEIGNETDYDIALREVEELMGHMDVSTS